MIVRILMAGASGFLGTRLAERWRAAGHDITLLVRRPPTGAAEARWDPAAGRLDPAVVAAADAVVNLAGAGVADKRWNARYKSLLRSSRVDSTGTIAHTIRKLGAEDRPGILLQASAVGWYGDTGDQEVTEEAPAGSTFLADLCRVWEAAARPAEDAGTRVALLRTGLPLSVDGGLVQPLVLPFKLAGGARIGGGKQWWPWIAMEDWLRALDFLLDHEVAGPVNVVAPTPVTNAEFTRAFARALNRPSLLTIPGFALDLGLGEFAGEMQRSQRVLPGVLQRAGFTWSQPELEPAIRALFTTDSRTAAGNHG